MSQRSMIIANVVLIAGTLVIGTFLYPALPKEMVSHWDAAGVANGTLPKFWAIFSFPLIMILILGLSVILPIIDPMKKNVESFRRSYQNFFLWIGIFLFYLFVLMLGWNLGWRFNFTTALLPAFAVLWFIIGVLLSRSKRNWFVGIRTPWTMESEEVWDKTHEVGARVFKFAAAIILIGTFFPAYSVYFLFIPIALSALIPIVYSYIEFSRKAH
jgi:uncharacterized membrane protein